MLRIITLVFLALLVVGGFLLAVLNDRYKIVDTFQHKFFEVTTDTGGEICLAELEERGIEYKHIGKMGKDICIINDAVRIRHFENTTLSGAITVNCQTALNTSKWFEDIKNTCNKGQLFIHWNLEVALKKADFIMTLRLQKERMTDALLPSLREYHKYYGITHKHLYLCQPNVKILHPGPVNRGIEISSSLIDDPNFSLVQKQITNSIAIRMALLFLLGTFSEQ